MHPCNYLFMTFYMCNPRGEVALIITSLCFCWTRSHIVVTQSGRFQLEHLNTQICRRQKRMEEGGRASWLLITNIFHQQSMFLGTCGKRSCQLHFSLSSAAAESLFACSGDSTCRKQQNMQKKQKSRIELTGGCECDQQWLHRCCRQCIMVIKTSLERRTVLSRCDLFRPEVSTTDSVNKIHFFNHF